MMKQQRLHLLLGVSGGIAAYKIPLLVRLLGKHDVDVKVILTKASRTLVGEETLRTLSANPVFSDDGVAVYDMDHIRLAQWADVFLIAPATANTIAKLAHGIADNLLTTLALSFDGPLIVAPAMNAVMWKNPATVDNIAAICKRGARVLPVGCGELACGDDGPGRMLGIETILEYVLGASLPRCFEGKKILITSGATAEPIDPVRVITNRSSGRMGAACASAALCMGAEVTVITGLSQAQLPEGITVQRVVTASEMAEATLRHFKTTDFCIMAAAISDFRPGAYSEEKIHRPDHGTVTLALEPNPDIAAQLAQQKVGQYLVCFALETARDGLSRAHEKMVKKGCDMMVYNTVAKSLDTERAEITILCPGQPPLKKDLMHKRQCGWDILRTIAQKAGLIDE